MRYALFACLFLAACATVETTPTQPEPGVVPWGYTDLCNDPGRTPDWELHCTQGDPQ